MLTVPQTIIDNKDKLFKPTAYDIRAYVGEPGAFFSEDAILTPESMETVGALMGAMTFRLQDGSTVRLKAGDIVVMGYDNGPTSAQLAEAFAKGLSGQGIDVYDIGVASSGQVYHNQQQFKAQGHVQITRSHVEVTTNGAKFAIGDQGIHTYLLGQMNDAMSAGSLRSRTDKQGRVIDKSSEGFRLYRERMSTRYGAYFASKPRKIALNLFGGTAVKYKDMFLDILGPDTVILGADLNVNDGGVLADPTRKEMLARVPRFTDALKEGLRIYSFDLDADRLSVSEGAEALEVGGTGHYLGDELCYILADYKLHIAAPTFLSSLTDIDRERCEKIHEICTTVYVDPRYSSGVRSYVLKNGGRSTYHRKGHSLWKETMTANLHDLTKLLGYNNTVDFLANHSWQDIQIEASLHLFTTDMDDGTVRDDGLESVFLLERIADELGIRVLGDFFGGIPKRFVTKEIRTVSASNELKEKITEKIIDRLKNDLKGEKFSQVAFDGQLRVDWDTGFVMYGMSNTSPKLTFMAEGATVEERNNALAYILALHNSVKKELGDDTPMDIGENSFFKDDPTYDMTEPDGVDFNEPRAKAFLDMIKA